MDAHKDIYNATTIDDAFAIYGQSFTTAGTSDLKAIRAALNDRLAVLLADNIGNWTVDDRPATTIELVQIEKAKRGWYGRDIAGQFSQTKRPRT